MSVSHSTQVLPSSDWATFWNIFGFLDKIPSLSRAEIEQIERTHFAHLYEVEAEVTPKPPVLQALWANCTDY